MTNQSIIKRAIIGATAAAVLTVAATSSVFAKDTAKKEDHDAAHYTKVGLEDTGKATDRASKDTGKGIGVAFKGTGKASGHAAAATGRETGRVFKHIGRAIV